MQINMDFSQHVKEILNRSNVQVGSLKFVDVDTKKMIFLQRKKAILLIRSKVYEREIGYLKGDMSIDVSETELIPYLKKGQPVIVVLPTGGKKRYIVQAKISDIFIDRFQVFIQDPRSAPRFAFSSQLRVKARPLHDVTALRLQSGEIRVVRYLDEMFLDDPGAGATKNGENEAEGAGEANGAKSAALRGDFQINDVVLKGENYELADDFIRIKNEKPVEVSIVDISCGGMCAAFQTAAANVFFVDQLLAVECSFANCHQASAGKDRPVSIFVFAIIKRINQKENVNLLHMRFLASLPGKLQDCWQKEVKPANT